MKYWGISFFYAVTLVTAISCNSGHNHQDIEVISDSIQSEGAQNNQPEINITDLLEAIPSPLEFSSLILASGSKYTETYLNDINKVKSYNSDYKRAANLGVFGADLGYINLYGKTYSAIDYLNTVYQLSTELKIEEFFDFETVKRLAVNNQNIDSITHITTLGFERMNNELKKDNRTNISSLILIGGWVEGLHLTCEIAKSSKSDTKKMMDAIYDEHIVDEDLLAIVSHYQDQPFFNELYTEINVLKEIYENIIEVSDDLTKKDFEKIHSQVEKIREIVIK